MLADGSLSTLHTMRLASLSVERVREVAEKNLDHLEGILTWMSSTPLRLFRFGSSLVPFASHDALDFDWEPLVADRLAHLGSTFLPRGFRCSMHPGQYTILSTADPALLARAVAEIRYSCRVLDLLGADCSGKVVIHGGAIYGDRPSATKRLIENLRLLEPHIRRRLVLENDERQFNLEQIVEVSEASGVPVVFDLHHHRINPSVEPERLLERARKVWDCTPKVHLSSQRLDGRPGAHDDGVDDADLEEMLRVLPFEADIMVEAKSKEVAARSVYERLWDWGGIAGEPEPWDGSS
jgi:UV DNA damage endonuclease